jgi:hypothetical protein
MVDLHLGTFSDVEIEGGLELPVPSCVITGDIAGDAFNALIYNGDREGLLAAVDAALADSDWEQASPSVWGWSEGGSVRQVLSILSEEALEGQLGPQGFAAVGPDGQLVTIAGVDGLVP